MNDTNKSPKNAGIKLALAHIQEVDALLR
ncbi:hypothetical protein EYZ11_012971 [Aspergillus tanneri]|uniref:Uncharacterized protein n=1 Tax=Aspergillus tanneri TaxID=1220188 RepID=A0A4S3IZC5_9EURO|nr:hypothetical protein EYZ11_012971 [Aspergillus tanneri]